jgi:hypothetical protein
MSGFEMSPFGMVPIGTPSLEGATPEMAAQYVVHADYGHNVVPSETAGPPVIAKPATPVNYAIVRKPAPNAATSPGSVVKAARARVKEIKAELRRLKALQSELGELERLLKAAKQKPTASVRPLRSVG